MKYTILTLFFNSIIFLLFGQNNPVIDNVPDVGVINYNGQYYLAGVNTNGGFYISSDLINWNGPEHVFSMNNGWTKGKPFGDNQIHAADIVYRDGKFHFYWSVNYWGGEHTTIQIGHAVADNIMGPYVEPDKKNWFDGRIDPDLFIDSDSSQYFYTVKFTDGNTLWGQRMKDPWTHAGSPVMLFNSLPLTWERMDNSVTEGPEVIKYRSRYYLMYNANHTGSNYGNYALGVAEADHPLGFNSSNKYPNPVVQSNLDDHPSKMRRVFASSLEGINNWKYITDQPADNWMLSSYSDNNWKKGGKGFGNEIVKGSTRINPLTNWHGNDIWVRKQFKLSHPVTGNIQLLVNHIGPTEIYIDGQLVYKGVSSNYATINLLPRMVDELKNGEHVIAMHSQNSNRGSFCDVDLIELVNGRMGDDILYNPGQPNLLKGTNGFEWWLVYFGIKNGGRKGQFINRVLFNDHTLTVDGPTGNKTSGFHPNPSQPTFSDLFESGDKKSLTDNWNVKAGDWKIGKGELEQVSNTSTSLAFIKSEKATNYLFKSGVKCNTTSNARAGIIACYVDSLNFLEAGLDQQKQIWYYRLLQNGKETIQEHKLSALFNYQLYHSLSIYKNDKTVELLIDELPAPGNNQIIIAFDKAGIPGLFTNGTAASFDGVIYTRGWDEYNQHITGWGNAINGKKAAGNHTTNEKGIHFTGSNFMAFKGDLLKQYEFSAQVYFEEAENKAIAGIYPVYKDENNYLETAIDYREQKLILTGRLNGASIPSQAIPLKRTLAKYPNQNYSDHSQKLYSLKERTVISGLSFVKSINNKQDFANHLFDSLKIEYQSGNDWKRLSFEKSKTGIQSTDKITFQPITTNAIRITNPGNSFRLPLSVYKLYTDEEQTSDYNLRIVKLADKVVIFLDGEQVAEVNGAWPASQVGLFGSSAAVRYNGILLFERP